MCFGYFSVYGPSEPSTTSFLFGIFVVRKNKYARWIVVSPGVQVRLSNSPRRAHVIEEGPPYIKIRQVFELIPSRFTVLQN